MPLILDKTTKRKKELVNEFMTNAVYTGDRKSVKVGRFAAYSRNPFSDHGKHNEFDCFDETFALNDEESIKARFTLMTRTIEDVAQALAEKEADLQIEDENANLDAKHLDHP